MRVMVANSYTDAAIFCVKKWNSENRKMSDSIRISQVGFGYDTLDHEFDEIFSVNFLLKRCIN